MHPAAFRYGGAYISGQRFFAEKNWQGDFEEDTLSVTLTASGNFEFRESIWDWELAFVQDDYYYLRGGQDVMKDGLARWTCGGAANSAYSSYCEDGPYGFTLYNPDTFWGSFETAQSYNLWEYAYIEGDSSSETVNFNVAGDLFTMPAGPVQFALHLDDTTTEYEIDPGPQYDADNVVA